MSCTQGMSLLQPASAAVPGAESCAAMASAFKPVHSSALCIIPPPAVWQRLQTARCFRDESYARWPPHINLLYPFAADGPDLQAALPSLGSAAGHMRPFRLTLQQLGHFRHGPRSFTLWLRPDSAPETGAHANLGTPAPAIQMHMAHNPSFVRRRLLTRLMLTGS